MTSDLFDANLAAFEAGPQPQIARAMRAIREPSARLAGTLEGGSLNLDLGHTTLYEPDALTFASKQVEAFTARPTRHFLNISRVPERSAQVSHDVIRDILSEIQGQDFNAVPDEDAGYLVSFGLGLGLHLPLLLERLAVRSLVIVEQFAEFLFHSMHVLPWAGLFEMLRARGGDIRIHIGDDPQALSHALVYELRGRHFPMLDGSYFLKHYTSPVLDAAMDGLRQLLPIVEGTDGFFEDEYLMLKQGTENFLHYDFRLLTPKVGPPLREFPVFIVGSGPSLDDCIEPIRRNRENAIVITGGTGLGPMLRNGVRPDFHCEIENTPEIADGLEMVRREHDFSGITLIAANNVHPDVIAKFDSRILYWRDSIVPSRLFAGADAVLPLAGPTVTNLAVRAAIAMGFYEFYLFGIDLGSRNPDKHHSDSSVYATAEDEYWKSGTAMEPLTIPVEGNLGETVYTNRPFLLTRMYFKRLFDAFPQHHFFNCSSGARLGRAAPVIASTLIAEPAAVDHREYAARCRDELPFLAAGAAIDRERLAAYRDGLDRWFDDAAAAFDAAGKGGIVERVESMLPLLQPSATMAEHSVESAVKGTCTGSMISILQFGYFLYRRLPPEDRARFLQIFDRATRRRLDWMRREILALADDLLAQARAA